MHKIARICFNALGWERPSGHARGLEAEGTYNQRYGFGHEEWLFRSEWLIDGWRYSFIQGVNKSRDGLVKAGLPFDVTLFTIEPDKRRRLVARVLEVECLDDKEAKDAIETYREFGWYGQMVDEIRAVGGDVQAFGSAEWAPDVLNVRFQIGKVKPFARNQFLPRENPIFGMTRYQLYDAPVELAEAGVAEATGTSTGLTDLPNLITIQRVAIGPRSYTPEHRRMQAKLMEELRVENPGAFVQREDEFVDVTMRTNSELVLFEIKSDLEPRTVIRQALGQILEYAFHPDRRHPLKLKLVIVGRRPLPAAEREYLERLQTQFSLPLNYRVVAI